MKIRWHEEALAGYEAILAQAGERNPLEHSNFKERVRETLRTFRDFPRMGLFNSEVGCYEKFVPRTRVLLIYHIAEQQLRIVAAFHTSRDPQSKPFERRNDAL
jgi:plasmid stabilization system protein ParE